MKRATLILLLSAVVFTSTGATETKIAWQPWSDNLFAQARLQKRFVLLDLEAVWCHWCHVMDETTYRDPAVVGLLRTGYITVRVDQDSRPDLSNRYEDYGWPATVVFGSDGKEIVRRRGYIAPKEMAAMLRAINADPSPGPSVTAEPALQFPKESALPAAMRESLRRTYLDQYDNKNGGWGFTHKYLDGDSVEYSLVLAQSGDAVAERMAKQTLAAQLNLLDPVWGGVYQYSTGGNWKEPHFEKIMSMQAENLRIYALAYQQWRDPAYLHAAKEIDRYLRTFLQSPNHAFYTSQDADVIAGQHSAAYFHLDDRGRRKQGLPRVDTHIYARENGWAIRAYATLFAATGEAAYLSEATDAAEWIITNRSLAVGGFRHGEKDAAGPFLADTLAMGRAFLNLYVVTGDRKWLERAEAACGFIARTFGRTEGPGYRTSKTAIASRPQRDENVMLARFANLLFHYTGKREYRVAAGSAMRYVAAPPIARLFPTAAVLLIDRELAQGWEKPLPDWSRLLSTSK